MHAGDSLTAASRKAGTSPRTVKRYAGSDLGRIGARYRIVRDRAYRQVLVLTNTEKSARKQGKHRGGRAQREDR